jgi:hypothetical protein
VHPALLLGFLAALLLVARWSVKFNLPAALPADAPMELFSEDRALAHARALADDIGVRVVGTAGVEAAERYVAAAAEALASEARATRPDLDVEFLVHRPTGSFRLNFLNHDIANAYTNLTNVAVRVRARRPDGTRFEPRKKKSAVLLNAHFDTTLGSPGGADCASCVGILLEQLRVLIHPNSNPPLSPIIFLLNGGEETFMQAAHGFVAHHPWADEPGAVINVEATGTSGPDVLFRETGGWPAELYMKHAPRPVATATVRDLVRFANLPVDTDFSVFRDPTFENGNLPGVDIASMLDGYSYHTDRDVVSRIRKGSIQAYGENVMRATEAFAAKLAILDERNRDERTRSDRAGARRRVLRRLRDERGGGGESRARRRVPLRASLRVPRRRRRGRRKKSARLPGGLENSGEESFLRHDGSRGAQRRARCRLRTTARVVREPRARGGAHRPTGGARRRGAVRRGGAKTYTRSDER